MDDIIRPTSLIYDGILCFFNVYRSAKIGDGRKSVIQGRVEDMFHLPVANDPFDGSGTCTSCERSVIDGYRTEAYQYKTLNTWNVGISCQLSLINDLVGHNRVVNQMIMLQLGDIGFEEEFNRPRSQNWKDPYDGITYRIMKVYELKKGTNIPDSIGIERDGLNHVCLYPKGAQFLVSDIDHSFTSFTIDVLKEIETQWIAFALFKVKANGYVFPSQFPPSDDDIFPFIKWIEVVILHANGDIPYILSLAITLFTHDDTPSSDVTKTFFQSVVAIAEKFLLDCSERFIDMNRKVLIACKFVVQAVELTE